MQMMILGQLLIFLRHSQISVLIAMAILEECCMASEDTQWLFYSGEQIVAHEALVFINAGLTFDGFITRSKAYGKYIDKSSLL